MSCEKCFGEISLCRYCSENEQIKLLKDQLQFGVNAFNNLLEQNKILESKLAKAREALEFTLKAAEYVFQPDKPLSKGFCPTFYHTLTYEGDLELIEKVNKAREALKEIE